MPKATKTPEKIVGASPPASEKPAERTSSPEGAAVPVKSKPQSPAKSEPQSPAKSEPQLPVKSELQPKEIKKTDSRLRRFVPVFLVLLIAVTLFVVITSNWNSWVGSKGSQKTDDAYLRADITPLSTRVSGAVWP